MDQSQRRLRDPLIALALAIVLSVLGYIAFTVLTSLLTRSIYKVVGLDPARLVPSPQATYLAGIRARVRLAVEQTDATV